MRERLSSERGMTLPEVLVTMVIALVLSLATFALVDVTIRRTGEISQRVDGVQRGRVAMDLMTRQLRSQVCLGPNAPSSRSIVAGTATSVTFYVEMGDPSTAGSAASPSATPAPRVDREAQPDARDGRLLRAGDARRAPLGRHAIDDRPVGLHLPGRRHPHLHA